MRRKEELCFTPRDTSLRTIQVSTEGGDTEEITIEVSGDGGPFNPKLPPRYLPEAQGFVITFSMNSRASFNQIRPWKKILVDAGKKHCPIALVGMQAKTGPLQVTVNEAAKLAAKLKTRHFHVQSNVFDQVMDPFRYLASRHIQARKKPSLLAPISAWFYRNVWNSAFSQHCIWSWMCFPTQHFKMERLEDTNAETTVYDLGEPPFTNSTHYQRRPSTSNAMVTKDELIFHHNEKQHRHFYVLENPDDRSLLEQFRRQIPWSVHCPSDQCSSEEFLQVARAWPSEHPHKQGTPALWDIVRDNFKKELQVMISNFPTHQVQCHMCQRKMCPELCRLMFMLLQDNIGTSVYVQLDDRGLISATGTMFSQFQLTKVEPQNSSILLVFQTPTNERSITIEWDDLWGLNSYGIQMPFPVEIVEILPLWLERPI